MEITKMEIVYPQWTDVGVPVLLRHAIDQLDHGLLLSYLIEDRVFHIENKPNYIYTCGSCGWHHIVRRAYEAYDDCQKCGSKQIRAVPFWKNNKDNIKPSFRMEHLSYKIAEQMSLNHKMYFNCCNKEYLELGWLSHGFRASFKGGTPVIASSPYVAIAKAALSCCYLWDASFNWKLGKKMDRFADFNITHLVHQWL